MVKFSQLILTELGAKVLSHPLISSLDQAEVEIFPQIHFGVNENQTAPPFAGLCRVRIEARLVTGEKTDSGSTEEKDSVDREAMATAVVEYVGKFDFDSSTVDEYMGQMNEEENHMRLVNQLYPLAVSKLKLLIEEMGFSSDSIPLNPPESSSEEAD